MLVVEVVVDLEVVVEFVVVVVEILNLKISGAQYFQKSSYNHAKF